MTVPHIKLTDLELKIQSVLLQVVDSIHRNKPHLEKIHLRIAGGWVRDKLMGHESNDIDVAIDTMNGEPFAQYVKEWMHNQGHLMSNISKIKVNPDKSKHLETATANILGVDIDFVNLRSETYHEDSRNPEITFGTPLEDALRRDITINSLFYNLHSNKVEDYTGKGIDDLRNSLIRTPLSPYQTFLDDPLRILRVIRFATRFGFQLSGNIAESVQNTEIQLAFAKKLSRERVGKEIEKMFAGPDPSRSVDLLYDFGFHHLVFTPPENVSVDHSKIQHALSVCRTLTKLIKKESVDNVPWMTKFRLSEHYQHLYIAAIVSPYKNLAYKAKGKDHPVDKFIICHSLKLSTLQGDYCHKLLSKSKQISKMVKQVNRSLDNPDRTAIGMLVRELGQKPLAHNWDLAILISLVFELTETPELEAKIVQEYQNFMKTVISQRLSNAYEMKPLLDGHEIGELLKIKRGPRVGMLLHSLIEWQLAKGEPSKEEAIDWLKSHNEHI
ncbi:CCA tRNA nucleotidyltransferase, mitochondrial [Terramyces sp. JEL0728]|nr:CCA tRNA nucleotidyltransferase, mitochondrial [Terramyces sp. JEL0728]